MDRFVSCSRLVLLLMVSQMTASYQIPKRRDLVLLVSSCRREWRRRSLLAFWSITRNKVNRERKNFSCERKMKFKFASINRWHHWMRTSNGQFHAIQTRGLSTHTGQSNDERFCIDYGRDRITLMWKISEYEQELQKNWKGILSCCI